MGRRALNPPSDLPEDPLDIELPGGVGLPGFGQGDDEKKPWQTHKVKRQIKYDTWQSAYAAAQYDPLGTGNNPFREWLPYLEEKLRYAGIDPATIPAVTSAADFSALLEDLSRGVGPLSRQRVGEEAATWLTTVGTEQANQQRNSLLEDAQKAYEEWQESGDYDQLIESINSLPPSLGAETLTRLRNEVVATVRQDETARQRRVAATLGLRGAGSGGLMGAMVSEMAAAEADNSIAEGRLTLELKAQELARKDELERLSFLDQALRNKTNLEESYLNLQNSIQAGVPIQDVGAPFKNWSAWAASLEANRDASAQWRQQLQAHGLDSFWNFNSNVAQSMPWAAMMG